MNYGNKTNPRAGQQIRLVRGCLRTVLGQPTLLLYPVSIAVVSVTTVALIGLISLSVVTEFGPNVPLNGYTWMAVVGVCLVLNFVVLQTATMVLQVAYCYEIDELLRGRHPNPGSGLAVAAGRLPKVFAGAFVASSVFVGGYLTDSSELRSGVQIVQTFLAPAVALEEGSVREIVGRIDTAVAERWGTAYLASYGVKTISSVLGVCGIGSAVGLVVGYALGVLPFDPGLSGVLALAVTVFLAGFFLAAFVSTFVTGIVSTALYHSAVEGQVPEQLALGVEGIAEFG